MVIKFTREEFYKAMELAYNDQQRILEKANGKRG